MPFDSESARAAAERRHAENRAKGRQPSKRKLSQRQLAELPAEEAADLARQEMQKLLAHKDPRIRREAAKYVLDATKKDEPDQGPRKIVYETRALPPTYTPRSISAEPPPTAIAVDA